MKLLWVFLIVSGCFVVQTLAQRKICVRAGVNLRTAGCGETVALQTSTEVQGDYVGESTFSGCRLGVDKWYNILISGGRNVWVAATLSRECGGASTSGRTVLPGDSSISYTGRVEKSNLPKQVQFDWSATTIRFNFKVASSKVNSVLSLPSIQLIDRSNHYNYKVIELETSNPIASGKFSTNKDSTLQQYSIGSFTPTSSITYQLIVEKRTEASFGIVTFEGFRFSEAITPVPHSTANNGLKMLFIGDSITCGYGAEGKSPCHFSATTENVFGSFATQTGQILKAKEIQVVCWSGKGMVRNFGAKTQTSPDALPIYFSRTLANRPTSRYNFSEFVPNIIVITLGSNDFSTSPRPSLEQFSQGYNQFLDILRSSYGKQVQIVVADIPAYQKYTSTVVANRRDSKLQYVNLSSVSRFEGCNGHPTTANAAVMANYLAKQIQTQMGTSLLSDNNEDGDI